MAKKTALIDLGSNGIRLAIYERTSRFGFYILHEQKFKFRLNNELGSNCAISDAQINRLCQIINYFQEICANLGAKKLIAIGTSSLRDASNQKAVLSQVAAATKIRLKVLSGEEEAALAAFGAINLLYPIPRAICLDIGGGSADLALCENGRVISTCSLDLGTVRLSQQYESDYKACCALIKSQCERIPQEFACAELIAIGGSLRAISNALMQAASHPLRSVHGYTYDLKTASGYIKQLYKGGELSGIKKERFDTIRIGALVFAKIADAIGAKRIITSGAGVREGLFLRSILGRASSLPAGFNPSLRSLEDRFLPTKRSGCVRAAACMYDALKPLHNLPSYARDCLLLAARAAHLGKHLSFYSKHAHAAYFVRAGLNFRIRHEHKALIATIIELHGKKFEREKLAMKALLPDDHTIMWLNFILAFCRILCPGKEAAEFKLLSEPNRGVISTLGALMQRQNPPAHLAICKSSFNALSIEQLSKIHRPKELDISINSLPISL